MSREPDRDDDFERYIQELVASAPPLTEETRRKLAALLDPSTSEP